MAQFRWTRDGRATWNYVSAGMPYNIAGVVSSDDVIVQALADEVSLAGGPSLRNIAGRMLLPSVAASSIKSARGRTQVTVRDDVATGAQFVFPNWCVTQFGAASPYLETNGLGSMDIQAAVEYPSGTIAGTIAFSGSATGTIAAGANLAGIYTGATIPKNVRIGVRWRINSSSGLVWVSSTTPALTSASYGDAFDSSATQGALADNTQTLSNAYTNNAIGALYGPIALLSVSSVKSPILFGTSIVHGENDTLDSTLDLGLLARALGTAWPYINCGVRGDSAYRAVNVGGTANFAKRMGLCAYATEAIIEYGPNDVGTVEARSATQCLADRATMYAYLKANYPSLKISQTTTTPLATSTDAFATVANQTPDPTVTPKITAINDAIRAGNIVNLSRVIEISDLLCSGRNSGKWACPTGYTPLTNSGGLHPLQAGYKYVRDSGIVIPM